MSEIPLLEAHRPRCGPVAPSRRSRVRALVLILVHVAVVLHIVHWLLRSRTLSALEPSEAATTLEQGVVNAGFVLFLVLVASTLVLGRFFCGWACHVVAYQDLSAWLLTKAGLRPRPLRARWLALVPLWAAFEIFVSPNLPFAIRLFPSPALEPQAAAAPRGEGFEWTTTDLWERFPGLGISVLTLVVDGCLLVWWLGAKGFCTYGCPYGAVFGIADRFAPGRIVVNDACEGCGHCTAVCTSNVRVHDEVRRFGAVVDPGCMKCMDCVDVCPKDALAFGFGAPSFARTLTKPRSRPRGDWTTVEEGTAILVFAAAVYAFRGLYDRIPFLLAIGLAVMAAVGAVTLARLLTHGDLLFQQVALKRGGRPTAAGWAAAAVLVMGLTFTAHAAVVQTESRLGEGWLRVASRAPAGSPERTAARDAAERHLLRAEAWGLVPDGKLQFDLANVAVNRGEMDHAAARLRASIEANPRNASAWARLVELRLRSGDRAGAEATAAEARARNPRSERLAARLDAVLGAVK